MNHNTKTLSKQGDCEVKLHIIPNTNGQVEVRELFLQSHGMWMCQECIDDEARLTRISEQNAEARVLVERSRKVDQSVTLVTDIYNAKTIPITELHAAILQNTDIPDADKNFAFAMECQARLEHYQKIQFDHRQEQIEIDNTVRAWQSAVQTAAGKLQGKYQEEFEKQGNERINYKPTKPKSIKSAATPATAKPRTSVTKQIDEVRKWSAHYGVDASTVQMFLTSKVYKSAEEAARKLAESDR
jgi:hypothetical protein